MNGLSIERIVRTGLDDHVDMIGHDAPGQKAITPAVEMEQCCFDKLRDVRPTQPACTQTGIQRLIGLDKVVGKRSEGLGNSLGRLSSKRNVTNWTVSGEPKCGR